MVCLLSSAMLFVSACPSSVQLVCVASFYFSASVMFKVLLFCFDTHMECSVVFRLFDLYFSIYKKSVRIPGGMSELKGPDRL